MVSIDLSFSWANAPQATNIIGLGDLFNSSIIRLVNWVHNFIWEEGLPWTTLREEFKRRIPCLAQDSRV